MGFSACISFALTEPGPGTVRLSEIARLIRAVEETGLFQPTSRMKLECRFGDRYDHDIDSIMELVAERPHLPTLLTPQWMPMDIKEHGTPGAIASRFIADDRSVYRASIEFGSFPIELCRQWTIEDPTSRHYFRPQSLEFSVDPWTGESDEQNANVVLGYLALDVHGDGNFFPRTAKDYIDSIASHPAIATISRACAEIWPASSRPATDELTEIRSTMRKLWPHPLDLSTGWHWIGHESF